MANARVRINPPKTQQTPSEAVLAGANLEADVVAADGRTIRIRKLTALDQMRLSGILGGERAKNEVYLGYAALAFSVMAIDGEEEGVANTHRELEALVGRLGEVGLGAVADGHIAHFNAGGNGEDLRDAVKN